MRYALALLTHGDALVLERCLRAFANLASPEPTELICVVDGDGRQPPADPGFPWRVIAGGEQRGFCAATAELWHQASQLNVDYVWWQENDFECVRAVDLRDLAELLDSEPSQYKGPLAQVALMRDAYSDEEKAAGGLFEYRRDDFTQFIRRDGSPWWLKMPYFTTNPSLMRRDFMAAHPFLADEPHCEGKHSIRLANEGFSFGTWGDGSVYVKHIGHRSGFGY